MSLLDTVYVRLNAHWAFIKIGVVHGRLNGSMDLSAHGRLVKYVLMYGRLNGTGRDWALKREWALKRTYTVANTHPKSLYTTLCNVNCDAPFLQTRN